MDSPTTDPSAALAIVMSAIALVAAVAILAQRLPMRRAARAVRSVRSVITSAPVGRGFLGSTSDWASAPAAEEAPDAVTVEAVRCIVDPAMGSVTASYAWRPATWTVLPFDVLGYDGSKSWTNEESDGLVALFHLGTDLDALSEEADLEVRVLVEELARRVFGAVDPVVDPSRPRAGAEWTADECASAAAAYRDDVRVDDIARQLGRDQLDIVWRFVRDDVRVLDASAVR